MDTPFNDGCICHQVSQSNHGYRKGCIVHIHVCWRHCCRFGKVGRRSIRENRFRAVGWWLPRCLWTMPCSRHARRQARRRCRNFSIAHRCSSQSNFNERTNSGEDDERCSDAQPDKKNGINRHRQSDTNLATSVVTVVTTKQLRSAYGGRAGAGSVAITT